LFLIGLIVAIMGLGGPGVIIILTGLVCAALYAFKKSFFISIQTYGGHNLFLYFKRSFIENVPVDISKVKEAVARINGLVLLAAR
jgi:hypothetical protein